jgi:hypothetical protein
MIHFFIIDCVMCKTLENETPAPPDRHYKVQKVKKL